MKKYTVIISALLTVILLSSCTGKTEENKVLNNGNENVNTEKVEMMNNEMEGEDSMEHGMMDDMEGEWTEEEMAEMGNMEHGMMMDDIEGIDLYNYVLYSEYKVKESKKLKVLFFNDNSSESIKTLKSNLQKSKIHDGLVMYQIDFNSDNELKKKYGVTSSHTFIQVDENLDIVRKWTGSKTIDEMHVSLTSPTTIVKMEEDIIMKSEGVYKGYSTEALSSSEGDVVLFFAASWCPSCKTADKNLSSETIPEGLTILKLDYDSNLDLRKEYGITSQHAFVQVDSKGNEIKKWYGSRNSKGILEELK